MKNEIEIPIQKQEDLVAANIRRDNYSSTRDLQAKEYNNAIASRLVVKEHNQIKCEKCGKEFTAQTSSGITKCAECR
jgi:Zn finger protein HypA/HybF involved in hydrogenase expression